MALQVTTASPGTISGTTTASPGTISGVASAPSGTISGVQSSPVASGTNYNPQSTTTPQPTATASTLMPGTTSGQNVNQTPTDSSQTFKLGDGSVYNINGQQISAPSPSQPSAPPTNTGDVQTAMSGASLATPTPDATQPSTSLNNTTGYGDILSMLNDNLNNMDKLFSNMSQFSQVGADEKAQQAKVASDTAAMTGLGYQAQGLWNPDNQSIALPFLTGQAQNKLVGAGLQSTLDSSVLNYMQGNRQFAFNSASTMYNASQQGLQTALEVYTKTAPQNIGTNYNPSSGQLTAIMRNPLTGETYTGNLGNIGAQHSFTSTNIATDPMTGALTFVGTTADGQVVQQPIGGGAGFNSSSVSSPLGGGNYTQTGNPQVANTGALLSNWTSGGSTMPGAGYQNAVYQEFAKQTGQKIDANTPTSTLISNIPALTQGIIKAENIGSGLVNATNNPTGILWANQPNATAYKASNGYTYAKFATYQDGVNAAQNLVARKLGASPTPNSGTQQQAIQTAPPAIQGAIRKLQDGTPFIDENQLTSAQVPMAQAFASQHDIPYVNKGDADMLNKISTTQKNLQDFSRLVNTGKLDGDTQIKTSPFKLINTISGRLNAAFGGTLMSNYNSYRSIAINSVQDLAGGQGSGLRLTSPELAQAIDNIPAYNDPTAVANSKLQILSGLLNRKVAQILPSWNPNEAAATQQANLILNSPQ